jgi:homopolymeric O-antigen transport system permease protein
MGGERDVSVEGPASIEHVSSHGPTTLEERSSTNAIVEEVAPTGPDATGYVTVIRPAPRWPHLDLPELWHFRELLGRLVWRDVVVRYKQTFLGVAWALLVPIFTAVVYVIVFGKFANFPSGDVPYPSLVIAGVLPMQYFASAMTGASMSLASNLPLVTKVYFPRALLPLAAVIVPMIDFLVGLPVLIALMWYYDTWPGGAEVLFAPAFMFLAFVTALGIGLFLSALNVRFRDVRYMIPVFLQVLPLLSGVMFAVDQIPVKWQWILAVNPMTAVIAGWRWAVLDANAPNVGQTALGVGVAVVLFIVGLAVFRSSEPRFADTI